MNPFMVKRLVFKDWHFNRHWVLFYLFMGGLALTIVRTGGTGIFYAGTVLFITVLIGLGIHLTFTTVVNDRKHKSLAFIMSLPISTAEYTAAKILANLLIFFIPWISLLVGSILVITSRETIPNGLVPLVTLLVLEILVAYTFLLGTALVTESEGWTVAIMICCNLFFNFFFYYLVTQPEIQTIIQGETMVWNSWILTIIGLEVLLWVAILAVTFLLQLRKKDFL